MGQICTVCKHPDAANISGQLAMGVAVSRVAEYSANTGAELSLSALRRHAASHLGRIADLGPDVVGGSDLIEKLADTLADLERVRRSALATARGDLTVKAASAGTRVIETLISTLGVTDLGIAEALREGDQLARAIVRATRADAVVGRAIEAQLRDIDADLADQLAAGIAATEHPSITVS